MINLQQHKLASGQTIEIYIQSSGRACIWDTNAKVDTSTKKSCSLNHTLSLITHNIVAASATIITNSFTLLDNQGNLHLGHYPLNNIISIPATYFGIDFHQIIAIEQLQDTVLVLRSNQTLYKIEILDFIPTLAQSKSLNIRHSTLSNNVARFNAPDSMHGKLITLTPQNKIKYASDFNSQAHTDLFKQHTQQTPSSNKIVQILAEEEYCFLLLQQGTINLNNDRTTINYDILKKYQTTKPVDRIIKIVNNQNKEKLGFTSLSESGEVVCHTFSQDAYYSMDENDETHTIIPLPQKAIDLGRRVVVLKDQTLHYLPHNQKVTPIPHNLQTPVSIYQGCFDGII